MNYEICMRCPFIQRVCGGPCPCTIDGRDILDHSAAGDCPKGFFADPGKMPPRPVPVAGRPDIPLAGDVVEAIAKAVGADRLAEFWERTTGKPCGCAERKAKLNRTSERLLKWWRGKSG